MSHQKLFGVAVAVIIVLGSVAFLAHFAGAIRAAHGG